METAASIIIPDGPCIETKVRTNSARLGTRYVNLQRIADEIRCTEGYLSKLFRDHTRTGSVHILQKVARALQISTDDLMILLEERKKFGNRPLSLQ